jgi:uroporphyrin-III C-methyltransferase/precorrin-2 dehydrogenase/sirohydrochlorin ferrochelatase
MGDPAPETLIYPLSLRVEGRRVLVVGGGAVAVRRVAGLRAAGADVLVVAPDLSPTLADLAARGLIIAQRRPYQPADIDGAWLAFACADRPEINAAVAADARRRRVWCVRADDGAASAAWVPAVGRSADATVAVNAGRNPRRAAMLRDRCVEAVEAASRSDADGARPHRTGRVSIVGGGPGAPGLITVAGRQRLHSADVVVTDRLAPLELLDQLAPDVEVIDAAKVPGGPATRQEQINRALVDHARAGRAVVRLKGGDPFVFGRGHEEVEACLAAGVPVEVVPGVTSAISVPAAAGIPVTHRGLSQGFCVVAGHASPADPRSSIDWPALARSGMTLVLLMAVEHLDDTAAALLAAGLDGDTPSACVADGWTRQQRLVTAPLRDIAAAVSGAGVANPAVIVIGDVAQFAAGSGSPGLPATPGAEINAESGGASAAAAGRLADRGSVAAPRRVLVLGGARSGKSAAAEQMLAGHATVDYVAAGPPPGTGDAEWDARVREHQRRRPARWRTVETLALDEVLSAPDAGTPALVDCLTTWLARIMADCGAWDGKPDADRMVADRVDRLVEACRHTQRHVVAVSNEIGSGVVPETASGRRFRDELGRLNARIAAVSDEVWLCTAGIARRLR